MSNSSKITASVAVLCALAGTAAAYFWPVGETPKIKQLQQQLIAADSADLSDKQRERITDQLIREVDQLDRERRRELTENVRAQMHDRIRTGVQQYQALAEADRTQFLDQELKDFSRWRGLMHAVHSQEVHVPRRFRLSLQDEFAETDGTPRPKQSSRRQDRTRRERNASDRAQSDQTKSRRPGDNEARRQRANSSQQAASDGDRRGPDRRPSGRSDRGRRRGWGMGPVEEGMEEQYASYWEALRTRRRERWEASRKSSN